MPDDFSSSSILEDPYDESKWLSLKNMLPMERGYRTAFAAVPAGWAASAVSLKHMDIATKQGGSQRVFIPGTTKLYEYTDINTIVDRTRASGGDYSTSVIYWGHAQYGDVSLYTNYYNEPQASSSGAFANLSGSPPKARYIGVCNLAVVLSNYDDGVNVYGDGWWASDIGAHTTWTPGASNQAANGRLLDTPGEIVAQHTIGRDTLLFKKTSVYVLSYVGRPLIWTSRLLDSTVGAYDVRATCNVGSGVIFYSGMDFFFASPTGVRRLTRGAGRYGDKTGLITAVNGVSVSAIDTFYDDLTETVYFVSPARCHVYHMPSDKWGSFALGDSGGAFSLSEMQSNLGGVARGKLSDYVRYDAASFSSERAPFFLHNKRPYIHSGATRGDTAWLQTAFLGREDAKTNFSQLVPVLGRQSSTAPTMTCEIHTSNAVARTDVVTRSVNGQGDGRFDFLGGVATAKRASFRITVTTSASAQRILDYIVKHKPDGK